MNLGLKKKSVLVVADAVPLKKQLEAFFESIDTRTVITAAHPQKGFELFCAHRPDLVVADLDMAPMDGFELTKEIRHSPLSPNCRTPVILLSTTITAKKSSEARIAGVSSLVLKPISTKDLLNHIAMVMNDSDDPIHAGAVNCHKQVPAYAEQLAGGPKSKESER